MNVKALFFGATAEVIGGRELELSIDEATPTRSFIEELLKEHPALANHKLLIAVNEEYADPNTSLKEGDEIAIFTTVSGG